MKCANCDKKIKQKDRKFCPECGEDVTEQIQALRKKRRWVLLGAGIPFILMASLVIAFFIYGNMKFDPQHKIDEFSDAVENDNVKSFTSILSSDTDGLTIDEDSASIFLTYLSNNENDLGTIKEKLEGQAASIKKDEDITDNTYATVQMGKDGKKWIFFDDYKLIVTPAYVDIKTQNFETDLYINDEKIDTTPEKKEDSTFEYNERFGPFMPGAYTLKGEFETPYVSSEQTEDFNMFNMEDDSVKQDINLTVGLVKVNSSFEDGATLFMNDQETEHEIEGGTQTIGYFPLDEPIDLKLEKKMPWETIESDIQTYQEGDSRARFEYFTTITDDEEENIFQIINDVFTSYTEALDERDTSLLDDHVTENLQEDLDDKLKEVDDDVPDYEGELIETQYRANWYQDPEYDDEREAYMFELNVMLTHHEPKGDLGWTFKEDDEHRYERATTVTMLFDENDEEWKVDDREGAHFFVYDGKEKDPKYERDGDKWKKVDFDDEEEAEDEDEDEKEEEKDNNNDD